MIRWQHIEEKDLIRILCEEYIAYQKRVLKWFRRIKPWRAHILSDLMGELLDEGKPSGYVENYLKAVRSWLECNEIRLVRKIIHALILMKYQSQLEIRIVNS